MSDIETTQTRLPVITPKPVEAVDRPPKEIRIPLTESQWEQLRPNLDYVNNQAKIGRDKGIDNLGMLVAQLGEMSGFRFGVMRVGFLSQERAILLTADGFSQVKADRAERDALLAVPWPGA